jgi:hypothetical protein
VSQKTEKKRKEKKRENLKKPRVLYINTLVKRRHIASPVSPAAKGWPTTKQPKEKSQTLTHICDVFAPA